jgi:ERCC4-type nuclease
MKVTIDCREQALYDKLNQYINTFPSVIQLYSKSLDIGDIAIHSDDDKPVYIIERKSLIDLLASIKDGRYKEQSQRLLHASGVHHHNILYIIEGSFFNLKTPLEKKIIYSALTSLNYFKGFSVMKTTNIQETAELIFHLSEKIDAEFSKKRYPHYLRNLASSVQDLEISEEVNSYAREDENREDVNNYANFVKKVKKDNITQNNIGEIILSQIPSVSTKTAIHIMKQHKTFYDFIIYLKNNPDYLDCLELESINGKKRKISKTTILNIKNYIFGEIV